jgi:Mn-dependent DtxR family transcriptional regulator
MTLTPVVAARIQKLQADGYLEFNDGRFILTEKGWRTLSAAAESPIVKPTGKISHDQLAAEEARAPRWGGLSILNRPPSV